MRLVAVVVAAALLALLGHQVVSSGDETVRPAAATITAGATADAGYADLVVDLQSLLTAYAALQGVAAHQQVHAVKQDLAGLELALRSVEERAAEIGADDVGALAATVRARAVEVLSTAAADHSRLGGVSVVQAFGRETALRAVRIGEAVQQADQAGWEPVRAAVAAPWPAPAEEGLGATGQ